MKVLPVEFSITVTDRFRLVIPRDGFRPHFCG